MPNTNTLEILQQLVHAIKQRTAEQIEALGLPISPMQVRLLKIIAVNPNTTAIDIVTRLKRDKAQITRLLAGLLEHNFILKTPNPKDKRSQCVTLSESGRNLLKHLTQIEKETLIHLQKDLSLEEIEIFHRTAFKMTNNIQR